MATATLSKLSLSERDKIFLCDFFGHDCLNTHQVDCINNILSGKDIFLSTRTGSGKSLIYQALPVIGRQRGENWLVLVVCPLISIMKEQTQYLSACGINAVILSSETEQCTNLIPSNCDVVYGTPEAFERQARRESAGETLFLMS